jgi:hypothetical protein
MAGDEFTDSEALTCLGDLLAAVEAGRQGVQENIHVEGDPELAFNGALVLICSAVEEMNHMERGAGEAWLERLRMVVRRVGA